VGLPIIATIARILSRAGAGQSGILNGLLVKPYSLISQGYASKVQGMRDIGEAVWRPAREAKT
jgi:hypothetical protein